MVFRNELSPFVFRIYGDIGLRWYGLAYLLGFLLGYVWLRRAAATQSVAGLTKEKVDALIWYVVVGVFAGGRLGFVAQSPGQLLRDPLFPLKLWEGGMAFFGGLIGVVIALLVFTRRHQVKFWSIADVLTVPAALGLGLGRIANFINAELWGKPTGANWGVIYPKVDELPRHPSELYESASHFLLALVLYLAANRLPVGSRRASGVFLVGYGVLRFLTDFYRDEPAFVGPLSSGQVASLTVATAGCLLLLSTRLFIAIESDGPTKDVSRHLRRITK
jgi:phosphatidylglycerol:prolipoprotein diacylglycerol transferase